MGTEESEDTSTAVAFLHHLRGTYAVEHRNSVVTIKVRSCYGRGVGLSASQMRAWTLRKQLIWQRSRSLLHVSKWALWFRSDIKLGWRTVWTLTPTKEHRSSMYPANHPNRGTEASPRPRFSLSVQLKECWISHTRKEDRDNLQPTWFQSGASQKGNTTEAPSHYRGGTNTLTLNVASCKKHFNSTLSNFVFLFIFLFMLVTSSCQASVHPPPALSRTEHLGSHHEPADVTQATKGTDFTQKDPSGREWGRRCLKLPFRHVHVKLAPAEDFHSF